MLAAGIETGCCGEKSGLCCGDRDRLLREEERACRLNIGCVWAAAAAAPWVVTHAGKFLVNVIYFKHICVN